MSGSGGTTWSRVSYDSGPVQWVVPVVVLRVDVCAWFQMSTHTLNRLKCLAVDRYTVCSTTSQATCVQRSESVPIEFRAWSTLRQTKLELRLHAHTHTRKPSDGLRPYAAVGARVPSLLHGTANPAQTQRKPSANPLSGRISFANACSSLHHAQNHWVV